MNRLAALSAAAWLLAGCATVPASVEVKVPVPVPCEAPDIQKPSFAIDALDPKAPAQAFDVGRALWATVEQHEAYEGLLEAALEACRK